AGHGATLCWTGPVAHGRDPIPEPPPAQQTVGATTLGIWQEDAYQLWLDVQTLFELRENLDRDSLRVSEIDAGLRDFTTLIDFELPREEFLATARAARARLQPLMQCVNGSTAPTLFAFGHGHLDVAWLWPLAETERKAARTLSNQIVLANEYPGYRFMHSQAQLFWMVKQKYPEFYREVKQAVKNGQIIAEGGMWVEADTNLTGGESLIRQFLLGKRFFQEEFGVDCQMLWLPDVFGYSAALPQIMQGCGIRYFSTQKIFWTYHGGDTFPYNTFQWVGMDGSQVLVHLHNDYNSPTSPASTIQRWKERVQKDGIATRLMPFGWGDGGGGPERDHVEFALRQRNLEGCPGVRLSGPLEFFKDLEERGYPDNRYVGELYYQAHRGTYTSQAKTKKGNRKCEFALREAEMWTVAAAARTGFQTPASELDTAWKQVLLNQFHDILPGSSIARVYAEAEATHALALKTAQGITALAQTALTDRTKALTVFNSLNWSRRVLVELPKSFNCVLDHTGNPAPVQVCDGKIMAEVQTPACGWITLLPTQPDAVINAPAAVVRAIGHTLENELVRVEFNERGEIASFYDKQSHRETLQGVGNVFKMYKDIPTRFDAWDIDSNYQQMPVALDGAARIAITTAGPLLAQLTITRKLNNSTVTQVVSLRRSSRRIDFATSVDWQESHKLLKVAFPTALHAENALHEIQFGHVSRPTHRSRPYDADRFEVCNHKWTAMVEEGRGFAILNDCKYGVDVQTNVINLTLLRAARAPDAHADVGVQTFTYAAYAWNGAFIESRLVQEGYELNAPVTTHAGAAGEASLFSLNVPNIVIEAVKPAEDAPQDVIVRLYETMRTATRCTLTTALPFTGVQATNLLEQPSGPVKTRGNAIELNFRPFEIKTLRFVNTRKTAHAGR
ncbi:MAG: glycoside hydrolase family 38 C-terminal domain-containing protein, partial [bacterium]